MHRNLRVVIDPLLIALLYIAAAKLGLAMAVRAEQVSAVWPPTGLALAAVVLLGRRAIPGVLLGAFIANATADEPLWVAAGIAVGNTLEAIVGAAIVRRFRFDTALARLRDVASLLTAVSVAPCVSATIGVFFLIAGEVHPTDAAPALWFVWWIGDALGGLIIAPFILVWSRPDREWRIYGFVEPMLLFLTTLLVGVIIFTAPPGLPVAYAIYPVLIWSALRLGPTYTMTATVLVNALAVAGTLSGNGPLAGSGPERGLVLVQCFMAVGATTALILAAIAAQSRQAHDRADQSEQRLRMAIAAARVGVWNWNIATGQITWSESLEPHHGLPRGGFTGTYEAYRKTIHPDDREWVEARIQKSVDTLAPYEAEFRLLGPDGIVRWSNARGVVLDDGQGHAIGMMGVGIDVTQQKELEEALRNQDRRKDEFLAMLGHELRNPLAAIVHAVDLLSSDEHREREDARGVIERQARTLSRLIDDLLDVSRITRGQIALERRKVEIASVVNAAVDVWRHLIVKKGQSLTIDIPDRKMSIEGDLTRLTQAVSNVVHNAAKFTPEKGSISIITRKDGASAVITIRDDGQGMTPQVLSHAFELFVQGSPSLARQKGGLGLGLTLVRRLVEMHGGTVDAASGGEGRGSEVTIRLPLATEEVAPPPSTAQPRPSGQKLSRRVLVVEDNADVREMLVRLARRDGHDVRAASDGHQALAEAASFQPEIVLLDIGLPGLDGYSVASELRASPATAAAFLVALTGYGQEEDRERAFAAGFDHHLLKPADPAQLLELLQRQSTAAR